MINPHSGPDKRPTFHATEFDRYYSLYKGRRTPALDQHGPLTLATNNAARANAAVKRHYPIHLKWLVSTGRMRVEGKPKRSRLKPCWLMEHYSVGTVNTNAFTLCLIDKNGEGFYPKAKVPRDSPAFLLEEVYYKRCPGKRMNPEFLKYVLKEYGYDLKL